MQRRLIALTLAALLGLSAHSAKAAAYLFGESDFLQTLHLVFQDTTTADVQATNQGWWSPVDTNVSQNRNYIVGTAKNVDYNNYFSFQLSVNPDNPVVAASLVLARHTTSGILPVTYSLFDVSTDLQTLWNKSASPNAAIYADLGSGVGYGSVVVTDPSLPDPLVVALNADAIAAINGIGLESYISIGGTLNPTEAIPEPATLALLGAGLLGLAAARRRKG